MQFFAGLVTGVILTLFGLLTWGATQFKHQRRHHRHKEH